MKKTCSLLLALLMCLFCCVSYAEQTEWTCSVCNTVNTGKFCRKCGERAPRILCPECGAESPFEEDTFFCSECGARLRPDVSHAVQYEGEGFATPEEALLCYMNGLKNQDFEQMLSAFAWETQIRRISFEKYFHRIQNYSMASFPRLPMNDHEFIFSANVNALRGQQVRYIYCAIEKYILGEDAPDGRVVPLKTDEEIVSFISKFDNGRLENLAGMSGIRIGDEYSVLDKEKCSPEWIQHLKEVSTEYYNADEIAYLVGMADLGTETLYCAPTIGRYGDRWYLLSLSSTITNLLGVSSLETAFFRH